MEMYLKRNWAMRLPWHTVGCGIQGDECLALAVRHRAGSWQVAWGVFGKRGDPEFARTLKDRVWRRDLWAPPWDIHADQDMVACGIDMSFVKSSSKVGLNPRAIKAAIRTQVIARYPNTTDPVSVFGLQVRGPEGTPHWVGAAAPRKVVDQSYRAWNRDMGIIHPHIASNAAALANVYLALYPETERKRSPTRMLVLEGRETTHSVLMEDWRLIDSLQYQMMHNQRLDMALIAEWGEYFRHRNEFSKTPVPLVLETDGTERTDDDLEIWRPLDSAGGVRMDSSSRVLADKYPDLAALAFGMALHGG